MTAGSAEHLEPIAGSFTEGSQTAWSREARAEGMGVRVAFEAEQASGSACPELIEVGLQLPGSKAGRLTHFDKFECELSVWERACRSIVAFDHFSYLLGALSDG